ncbi:SAM-dependent MidA family methyltransferase [Micromonospora pisi]|uniref:SAM-dependent MidA family methyltransferase n=1 Tax=Micromonospora pisi TaxID=589240 RepID=A0A495JJX2_9ACTN|nr:SAM-dependent methyltransferase [Micromonospora pisi]RKR88985.1 SAM-dependent MidA family methyltransferase [Micromonospora pisi]
MSMTWRTAMTTALYGPDGFFVAGSGPAAHFRTSAHVTTVLGTALLRLLDRLDAALGRPDRLDVVDVGAGRGELLRTLAGLAPEELGRRLRLTAVELAPRPESLPATIGWRDTLPTGVVGLVIGTEWLDNVPLDLAATGPAGWHQLLVDPATGTESTGAPVSGPDLDWLTEWWPRQPEQAGSSALPGARAEIGLPRDIAWAGAVGTLDRGLALTVDYGHLRADRPIGGTLTGFRAGRQVPPVPDGSCDLTAHVAMDSVAEAGKAVAGVPYTLVGQRAALRALGADGGRPPLALASTDPAGYVRALAAASTVTELTDPAGLGSHWWLLQPVGLDPAGLLPEPRNTAPLSDPSGR